MLSRDEPDASRVLAGVFRDEGIELQLGARVERVWQDGTGIHVIAGGDVMTCSWPMAGVDRARAEGDAAGLIKLIHRKNGTLLGATIVAARAGETIHEWIVALERGLKVGDLSNAIHVYPTYSIASMQAAAAVRVNQLLSGASGRVVQSLARLMRLGMKT